MPRPYPVDPSGGDRHGLNLVLIPHFSIVGAGWATIITEVVVLGVLVWAVSRVPEVDRMPWGIVARSLLAAAGLAFVVFALHDLVPWPIDAVAAGATYLGILHLVGIDGPGGLRQVRHLLRPV